MIGFLRAALIGLALLSANLASAADKPFRRDDLADAAIKLEAQIKTEAGVVAQARRHAARRRRRGVSAQRFRSGLTLMGQIVTTAPDDSASWLRLARTILQIRTTTTSRADVASTSAPRRRPISPISAPATASEEADALAVLGRALSEQKLWRPALDALRLSLDLARSRRCPRAV